MSRRDDTGSGDGSDHTHAAGGDDQHPGRSFFRRRPKRTAAEALSAAVTGSQHMHDTAIGSTGATGAAGSDEPTAAFAATTGDVAAESAGAVVTETGTGARPPRRPLDRSLLAFLVFALAVAVIVVAALLVHALTRPTQASAPLVQSSTTTTSQPATSTTTTSPAASTTTTTPASTTTTAAGAVAAAPGPCTANDVEVVTTTDRSTYTPGQPVVVTTKVIDRTACVFQPVNIPGTQCPTSVTVDQGGAQVWPAAGQGEQCSIPQATTLQPGMAESVSATWNQQVFSSQSGLQQAPAGTYNAVGDWGWSAGSGKPPVVVQAPSTGFVIS